MPAYLSAIPSAIPGVLTRGNATVEPAVLASSGAPASFGVPVAYSTGKLRGITASDDATVVVGFLVKSYPTQSTNNDFTGDVPSSAVLQSLLKRGYIGVHVNAGTAAQGGPVYVRIDTPAGAKVVGGIEASSDTTHSFAVTGAFFTGAADADGNAEVAFNL